VKAPLRVVAAHETAARAEVPVRVWRRAEAAGWVVCDVCSLPVDPAGVTPTQPNRHPGCICERCDAPLNPADERWHPQCRPANPVRRLRVMRGGRS
jgi:hypothetical protein